MIRVAAPPERPLLIFDGDCGFCRMWIARWRSMTGPSVDYAPSQEVGARFPEIPGEAFRKSVQLVLPDGRVLPGAHGVFATLAVAGRSGGLSAYERLPGFAPLTEAAYRLVANHRGAATRVTRLLWGANVARPEFSISSAIFLRLLGLVFFSAFVSLWTQIDGLVGSRGILPIAELLSAIPERIGAVRFWYLPTFSWAAPGDSALHLQCAAGAVFSVLLALGILPALCAAAATALLPLALRGGSVVPRVPMGHPAGRDRFPRDLPFASLPTRAVWSARAVPDGSLPRPMARVPPQLRVRSRQARERRSHVALLDGARLSLPDAAAASVDGVVRALDCRTRAMSRPSLVLFAIELVVPFFIFGPRRLRHAAFLLLALLQAAIALTGNYAFFNLLTVALCVPLLDDAAFRAMAATAGGIAACSEKFGAGRAW